MSVSTNPVPFGRRSGDADDGYAAGPLSLCRESLVLDDVRPRRLITALQMLWWSPEVARGVLRRLAAYQATGTDPLADAQPGKILHEMQQYVIFMSSPSFRLRTATHRRYRYKDRIDEVERAKNRTKSTVRSKVEHMFGVMKLKFGFVKLRYRGLQKNANQLFAVCALVNLYLARKRLLLLTPA